MTKLTEQPLRKVSPAPRAVSRPPQEAREPSDWLLTGAFICAVVGMLFGGLVAPLLWQFGIRSFYTSPAMAYWWVTGLAVGLLAAAAHRVLSRR